MFEQNKVLDTFGLDQNNTAVDRFTRFGVTVNLHAVTDLSGSATSDQKAKYHDRMKDIHVGISLLTYDTAFGHFKAHVAILTTTKKLLIESSLFESNTAIGILPSSNPVSGSGGALYMKSNSTCNIFNCSFQRNRAQNNGGAIHSEGTSLTVKASNFHNNSVAGACGAIFTFSLSLSGSISACSFESNKAIVNGGAVSCIGNKLLIISSKFQNNTVLGKRGEGGALFLKALYFINFQHINISHCFFDGNQASF